jgi:hypothetical protein
MAKHGLPDFSIHCAKGSASRPQMNGDVNGVGDRPAAVQLSHGGVRPGSAPWTFMPE